MSSSNSLNSFPANCNSLLLWKHRSKARFSVLSSWLSSPFSSFFSSFFLYLTCVPILRQHLLVKSCEFNLLLKSQSIYSRNVIWQQFGICMNNALCAMMHSIALWSPTGPWAVSLQKPLEDQWIFFYCIDFLSIYSFKSCTL